MLENSDISPKWHINNEIFQRRIRDSSGRKMGHSLHGAAWTKQQLFLGLLSLNQKNGESNTGKDAIAVAARWYEQSKTGGLKTPPLQAFCALWGCMLKAGVEQTASALHHQLTQSYRLTSPSPEVTSWGIPGLKGSNPAAPGCCGSPMAVALAVVGCKMQQAAPRGSG